MAEHFDTKLGMVMQHLEPEGPVDLIFCRCYLQGLGHSEGPYYQDMTLSAIFSESRNILLPNLVW